MSTDPAPMKRKTPTRLLLIIGFIIFVAFYAGGMFLFQRDAGADTATLEKGAVPANYVSMEVRVASIDPAKETAVLAITPEPQAGLTDDGGYSAKADFEYDIVTDDGTKTVKIKAGDPMQTTQIPISISGEVSSYPNDEYDGDVEIDSDTPFKIEGISHIQAFTADMDLDDHSKAGELTVNFGFKRSESVVIFAWFVYLLMSLVAALALAVATGVAIRGFKFEFGMIGWIGALLFVLPAIRNSLPGQPPIGTIGDFAVFFWAEIMVVVSLISLVVTWYRRSSAS
jgi:hypothetical protein